MKATQQLRDEHEGVKIMLSTLEQVCQQWGATGNLNREHFEGILEFLKIVVPNANALSSRCSVSRSSERKWVPPY